MKANWITPLALTGLLIVSTAGCAEDNARYIDVSGTGTVSATPDMVDIQFSFNQLDLDTSKAKTLVDAQISRLIDLCDDMGIEEADIHAAEITIYPEYNYQKDRELLGYRVNREIQVRLHDLSRYPDFLNAAINLGVTQGGNATFGFSDPSELEQQAITAAYEDARSKASLLADLADSDLGEALSISLSGNTYIPQTRLAMMDTVESANAKYQTGDATFTRQVQIRFELD